MIRRYTLPQSARTLLFGLAAISANLVAPASAQVNYPTFFTSTQITSFQLTGSPSLTNIPALYSPNHLDTIYVAYTDANSPNGRNLGIATSTDGINFNAISTNISMASDPAITFVQGSPNNSQLPPALYITFNNNTGPEYGASLSVLKVTGLYNDFSGTTTNSSLTVVPLGQNGGYVPIKPAISTDGNNTNVYIAWQGATYDPGDGQYDGQWINIAESTNGGSSWTISPTPVSEAYSAASGPAFVVYNEYGNVTNNDLYVSYLQSGSQQAQFFQQSSGIQPFTNVTGSGGAGGYYAGDPALIPYQGTVLAAFRSYYQEDNVWAVLGVPSVTQWEAPKQYGQTITYDPALVFSNGYLYQGGRTNYPGSGQYFWIQGTYQPGNGGGGGGGGKGSGPCGAATPASKGATAQSQIVCSA